MQNQSDQTESTKDAATRKPIWVPGHYPRTFPELSDAALAASGIARPAGDEFKKNPDVKEPEESPEP